MRHGRCLISLLVFVWSVSPANAAVLDLSATTVVVREGDRPAAEAIAPTILIEEIGKRAGVNWSLSEHWPAKAKAIIALSVKKTPPAWKEQIPPSALESDTLDRSEGFSIRIREAVSGTPATVFVTGADPRGLMFGVGKLLRSLDWKAGAVSLPVNFRADEFPDVSIRGHQLGYRARANSWDAWTPAQFDQYIRDLVVFGANSIENIPFEDSQPSVLMPVSREKMNVAMSAICDRYDVDYWIWAPVEFRLPDVKKQAALLRQHEEFYRACRRVDGVFVPGGDPGDNPARELMSFLPDLGQLLERYHPRARIWVSLQGFKPGDVDDFYRFIEEKQPAWFGGAVMGPSSPSLESTRSRLPKKYRLRWYPDITHTVRCQYPVPWFDPAFGVTLGREPVNPRPLDYAAIYRDGCRFTDGFLTYSDGIHDDFNKNLWTALGWQPDREVREIAIEYARYFFRPDLAEDAGDALLALETNWRGSIAENSSIDGTLLQWRALERKLTPSAENWRFEMHLMRAYYDAYTRHRQLYETALQQEAFAKLAEAATIGVEPAVKQARDILSRATTNLSHQEWFSRVDALAESLFKSIGYQTRMDRYHASGSERGVVMDFINYPLNDRWWLEDQFDRLEKLPDQAGKLKRIDELCRRESPPTGSFYDDVGHVGRSPRAPKLLTAESAMRLYRELPIPTQRWMGEQRRSIRFAWHTYLNRPAPMRYSGLDPAGRYTVRLSAQGNSPLLVDGKPARRIREGDIEDEVREQEFEVPSGALADGRLELTWAPLDESKLNWRQHHYVAEVWLIRHRDP